MRSFAGFDELVVHNIAILSAEQEPNKKPKR